MRLAWLIYMTMLENKRLTWFVLQPPEPPTRRFGGDGDDGL